jgi:hypothetical protein
MNDTLDRMQASGDFEFQRMIVDDIDNEQVFAVNVPEMPEGEISLVSTKTNIVGGLLYLLHSYIEDAMSGNRAAPVVRFADGEYAFYANNLKCNGLYRQAESVRAIRKALPFHLEAFKFLLDHGKAAPLIYPGNIHRPQPKLLSFFKKQKGEASARAFLDFIDLNGLDLNSSNYIPFYMVYAYLTSELFCRLVDKKTICIINSDHSIDDCHHWFSIRGSQPEILFIDIDKAYVATRWLDMRQKVLDAMPERADLCLVGAGVGALPVCVDVARHCSLPVIDAGHVVNMFNGLESKSNGPRLFTQWKSEREKPTS